MLFLNLTKDINYDDCRTLEEVNQRKRKIDVLFELQNRINDRNLREYLNSKESLISKLKKAISNRF